MRAHVTYRVCVVRWAILLCSSTSQGPVEIVILSDSEQASCKPVMLSSDSESCVDESGLGLESRYMSAPVVLSLSACVGVGVCGLGG